LFTRPQFYPPAVDHYASHSDLEDFLLSQSLHELLPVVRNCIRRGGLLIDGYNRITTVNELARTDPELIRAFFMRRDTYEPNFG